MLRTTLSCAALLGILLIATAAAADRADVQKVIADWPQVSQQAARQMIQQYGEPDGVTSSRLIWKEKDPWRAIVVYRDPVPHDFPKPHKDVLEQVISYQVPPDKFDELAECDGSIIAERTKGTLAARCDKEPMNFLALNLAHDVVTERQSVEEARRMYAQVVVDFMKGEKHPYTQKLHFRVAAKGRTGDPDVPLIKPGGQP